MWENANQMIGNLFFLNIDKAADYNQDNYYNILFI